MPALGSATARGRVALVALVALMLGSAPYAGAQEPATGGRTAGSELRGQVVKDGAPIPDLEVTLHRVTDGESGAVGTRVTDASGRFSFPLAVADSGRFNVYFTTADYHSVRYFGRVVHPTDATGEYTVEVFDTASVLPEPIRLSRRDMVLVPQSGGGWEVDEVLRLRNPNRLTLVPGGSSPSWDLRIPAGVEAFEVGESEIPADQIQRMEDRILVTTPLTPGEREMFIRYRIPARSDRAVLPFSIPADTFNLFIRQPSPRLEVVGVTSTDMVSVGEEQFLRYAATDLDAGSEVTLEWESVAPPVDPVVAAVVVTMLLLGVGAVAALRTGGKKPSPATVPAAAARELSPRRAE